MTTNPTPAEVQAAYDAVMAALKHEREPDFTDFDTLLAAVARDTLGWREVKAHETSDLPMTTTLRIHLNRDDKSDRYWIKDAPNADPS